MCHSAPYHGAEQRVGFQATISIVRFFHFEAIRWIEYLYFRKDQYGKEMFVISMEKK